MRIDTIVSHIKRHRNKKRGSVYRGDGFIIINDDCIERMKLMPANSVDAIVTDPPYGLAFMGKHWDKMNSLEYHEFSKKWGEQAIRVLKPGGHLLAFAGTRTYHRMVCGLEDAGFEIRNLVGWIYGTGFPKSMNISKAVESTILNKSSHSVARRKTAMGDNYIQSDSYGKHRKIERSMNNVKTIPPEFNPTTDHAKKWKGWGTTLKPAFEPVMVARKPFSGSVARNILEHGVGGLNIDASRIKANNRPLRILDAKKSSAGSVFADRRKDDESSFSGGSKAAGATSLGRHPANIIHDGSDEVLALFPVTKSGAMKRQIDSYAGSSNTTMLRGRSGPDNQHGDSGSAARFFYKIRQQKPNEKNNGAVGFRMKAGPRREAVSANRLFYCSKASTKERDLHGKNKHPTVKPIDLMRYLITLVTPTGGTILDPFMGSGSTGTAAVENGFLFIGIEKEKEYFLLSRNRIEKRKAKPQDLLEGELK